MATQTITVTAAQVRPGDFVVTRAPEPVNYPGPINLAVAGVVVAPGSGRGKQSAPDFVGPLPGSVTLFDRDGVAALSSPAHYRYRVKRTA